MPNAFNKLNPSSNKKKRITDIFDVTEFVSNKWLCYRFIDVPFLVVANHWFKIRKKDGDTARIPKMCLAYDMVNDCFKSEHPEELCPYCRENIGVLNKEYYFNAISRKVQGKEPKNLPTHTKAEKKSQFKDIDSDSWTPVQVIRFPEGQISTLQKYEQRNKNKSLMDDDYGVDLDVYYDPEKQGAQRFNIQMRERTPLDDEEFNYLTHNLDPDLVEIESKAEAEKDLKRMLPNIIDESESSDYNVDDDDDQHAKRRNKRKQARNDDDDDDEFDRPPRNRKRSRNEEDDDEEEERPKKRSRSRRDEDDEDEEQPKKRSRSRRDEDDDEEEERPKKRNRRPSRDEDDDEEEDRPSRKRSSKKTSREDDDEEEDRPRNRKRSRRDEEDDDEEEDRPKKRSRSSRDDDDDDEEEDRPRKRKRSRRDEDDEIDFDD